MGGLWRELGVVNLCDAVSCDEAVSRQEFEISEEFTVLVGIFSLLVKVV